MAIVYTFVTMLFLRRLFYIPAINIAIATLLRPFSRLMPAKLKFPVYGPFWFKIPGNKKAKYYTNPTSYHSKLLFWGGFEGFEYNSSRIFIQFAKNAQCMFDIGSNIGYYSLIAHAANSNVRVFAFEPMPASNAYLTKNLKNNGLKNFTVSDVAISNTNSTATFYAISNPKLPFIKDQLAGDGGLSTGHSGYRSKLEVNVKTIKLDDYVAANLPANMLIDLIKLDTEATEHWVLEGAHNVLSTHRPIIMCEVITGQIEHELEAILSKYNYAYYATSDNGLIEVTSIVNQKELKTEYFFVPVEKKAIVNTLS